LREFLFVFLFVAPFFLSFEGYKMYLPHEPGSSLFKYGVALLNALVLSKVILIGELAGLGRYSEHKPLIIPQFSRRECLPCFMFSFTCWNTLSMTWFTGKHCCIQ
jgi:hypothetical protein